MYLNIYIHYHKKSRGDSTLSFCKRNYFIAVLAMMVLIFIDQYTKRLAEKYLVGKGTIKILGDYFIFEFVQNRGGFLSFGNKLGNVLWWSFFVVIPIIALIFVSLYVFKKKISDSYNLTLWVLLVSCGIGNIIDRVLVGKVTDFMNVGIGNLRSGIFNVADLYIVIFTIIIIIGMIFKKEVAIKN